MNQQKCIDMGVNNRSFPESQSLQLSSPSIQCVEHHGDDTAKGRKQTPTIGAVRLISGFNDTMKLSTIEGWETPHTSTDITTFYSEDGPRRVYWDTSSNDTFNSSEPRPVSFLSSPSSTPPPLRKQKRKLSMVMSFPQKGECRSTPARHAANPCQNERHPNAQSKLKTFVPLIQL